MRPRKKKIKPLTLDWSGALGESYGITQAQIDALMPRLDAVRQSMMGIELEMLAGEAPIPESLQPLEAEYFPLPERLLAEYLADRPASELGQLFRTANRMHELADRIVVLGTGGAAMGGRALLESCCQPYWNELSRGQRGSRPRIYFEGDCLDNDAIQGLLHLLGADSGRKATCVEDRWGLVVIGESGESLETSIALRQFLQALETSCGGDQEWMRRLVIPITVEGGQLHKMALELGCQEIFPIPRSVGDSWSVLSAVGLVPAALLGINVIELLGGAAEMSRSFRETPAEENVVLQFVAVNHLLQKERNARVRVLRVWSKELEAFGRWYDQLVATSLGKSEHGLTQITNQSAKNPIEHQLCFVSNIIVDRYRFDALQVGSRESDWGALNKHSERTIPEIAVAVIEESNEAMKLAERPFANLHLPCIDELHIGQLFQMLMLATAVEGRLLGNPQR